MLRIPNYKNSDIEFMNNMLQEVRNEVNEIVDNIEYIGEVHIGELNDNDEIPIARITKNDN